MKYNTLRVMQRKSDKNVREVGLGLKNKGWRERFNKEISTTNECSFGCLLVN